MVISASRRTDLPAFYSDWFFQRLQEGYVLVRNPMNLQQVSRIPLSADKVDCIVFWTKDPGPMLPKLSLLKDYAYYFQFTLNPYDERLEPGVPSKEKAMDTFKGLSDVIGPARVVWRYDPVIVSDYTDAGYHLRSFEMMAGELQGYTEKCIISFVDDYRKVHRNFQQQGIRPVEDSLKREIAEGFAAVARTYGLQIETCAEEIDLQELGIGHGSCIDPVLVEKLTGFRVVSRKDGNQRKACGCMPSVDIGAYNTCAHGCIYCYANFSRGLVKNNLSKYRAEAPLLCGRVTEADKVTERKTGR